MKMKIYFTVLLSLLFCACNINSRHPDTIENQAKFFPSVTIGTNIWMLANLDTDTFRNGERIPEAKSSEEWDYYGDNGISACCSIGNEKKYGKLYNWYAVNDSRGLAPNGWRIPSSKEWSELSKIIKTINIDTFMNYKIYPLLFGGFRRHGSTQIGNIGYGGYWWSSTDAPVNYFAYHWFLYIGDNQLRFGNLLDKRTGMAIRCIKEDR